MIVSFKLNGREVEVDVEPNEILLDTLRFRLGVKSVKRGCERGECGTCTVLLDGRPVYSCMLLTVQVEGREVTTVEGLSGDELFRRIIYSFAEKGAIQCGYCSPGFLLTAYYLLKNMGDRRPSRSEIAKVIEGNLCRCTGYRKILDAIEYLVDELRK